MKERSRKRERRRREKRKTKIKREEKKETEERDKEIPNLYYLDLSHFKGKVNSSHTHYIIFFIDLSVSCEN